MEKKKRGRKKYTNDAFTEIFNKRIYLSSGASAQELATKFGVDRNRIYDWANGNSFPDPDSLIKISKECNISIDSLLGTAPYNTLDGSYQSACRVTGLAEDTIKVINEPQVTNGSYIINRLVESGRYKELNKYYRQLLYVALSAQDVIVPDVMIDGETYSMTKNDFLDTCSQKIGNVFAEQVKEILIEYAEIEPDKRAFLAGENFIRGLGKTAEQIKQLNADDPKEFNEKLNNAIRGKNNG